MRANTKLDALVTKNVVRSLAIAALACFGASVQAQTVLQLSYPSNGPGSVPCLYTTNGAGISADPQTGNLLAAGDFTTGCPQTGPTLPLPVIVPGPVNWQLPNPWAVAQVTAVQWAAVNAESCTYGGSFATGWPSGQQACSSANTCQTLHDVSLSPPSSGQYQFSLTCSNASGSVTSTSAFRSVSANPPVITQGPSGWNVTPWTAGQTKAVQWSANNADNCNFTANTLPAGVSIGQFLSGGVTSCSTQAGCSSSNNLILNAPEPGTYSVTLTCSRSTGGTTTNTGSWNVTQGASTGCLSPAAGWNRLEFGEVFNFGAFNSVGFFDLTQYDGIWGRNYSDSGGGYPIIKQWPGVAQQLTMPKFGFGQYIAAKFRTPNNSAGQPGHTLKPDGTSFAFSGGGEGNFAKLSGTVSTVCGDFNTSSASIPSNCKFNQLIGGDSMVIYSNYPAGQPFCNLQPNTDYYLNLIYAPLTSPASAVFNGLNGAGVVLLQNFGVQN